MFTQSARPWLGPLGDVGAIDDLLGRLHPTWALGRIKARVVRIVRETADTRTFVLQANRNWPGHRAGQHVVVEVEIDGVRHQRCYSLSSAPTGRRMLAVTVKRQTGGKVSTWLHDEARIGDVVGLDGPAGAFVLSQPPPARLLLLSAGSGITPLMSILRDLHGRGWTHDVAFVHVCRRRDDAIFGAELAALAASEPWLRLHLHYSREAGRFDVGTLAERLPDYARRHTMLCGPHGFMATLEEHWRAQGIAHRLQIESFGGMAAAEVEPGAVPVNIRCERSERVFTARGNASLLLEAERAGLAPRYGCRMGICHTCQCMKRSGSVEDLRTGAISSAPGERIQLCVTRARSDLVLDV